MHRNEIPTGFTLLENICTGNNAGITNYDLISTMLSFWNDMSGSLSANMITTTNTTGQYMISKDSLSKIEDNMKRRFPVLLKIENDWFIGGNNFKIAWSAWNNGVKYQSSSQTEYYDSTDNVFEVAHINIPADSIIDVIIDTVMICGSNPISHNAFIFNVQENNIEFKENGYYYYTKDKLYNYNKISNYPQD